MVGHVLVSARLQPPPVWPNPVLALHDGKGHRCSWRLGALGSHHGGRGERHLPDLRKMDHPLPPKERIPGVRRGAQNMKTSPMSNLEKGLRQSAV